MSEYISEYEKEKKKKEKKNSEKDNLQKEHEITVKNSKINLKELKEMVKEGTIPIDQKVFDKIQEDNTLDNNELSTIIDSLSFKNIVEKLEEITNNPEIENILPKELRITPKEFKDACIDKDKRPALLMKIDTALDYVNDQVRGGGSKVGGNPFSRNIAMRENLMFLANQKIIGIQEHMIDMKNYLQNN